MCEHDLERVRNDLETIQEAIGLAPSEPIKEIRVNAAFAVAGMAAVAWALLATGPFQLAAFAFFLVPFTDWLLTASNTSRKYYVNRDFRGACRTLFLGLPLAALFFWCRSVALSPAHFLSLSVFLIGMALFAGAVSGRSEASYVCWSVALMTGGLLIPLGIASPVLTLCGALGLGGLSSALVLYITHYNSRNYAAN
jgi:hypothetical protein